MTDTRSIRRSRSIESRRRTPAPAPRPVEQIAERLVEHAVDCLAPRPQNSAFGAASRELATTLVQAAVDVGLRPDRAIETTCRAIIQTAVRNGEDVGEAACGAATACILLAPEFGIGARHVARIAINGILDAAHEQGRQELARVWSVLTEPDAARPVDVLPPETEIT